MFAPKFPPTSEVMAPTDFIWNHERGRGQQSRSWSETTRLSVGLRGLSWSETPRLSVGLRGLSWSETPRLSVGLRVQVRQRVAGDGPRTDQNKGVKSAEVPPAENFPGCPGGCLSAVCAPWSSVCVSGSWSCGCLVLPGVGCRVPVSGALASSLVLGCCPCLPGSGFCAGFREKGRRPKNRSRRSFARAGLFQVFPGMLVVLERRYRGRILTLVHIVGYSPFSHLRRSMKSVSTRSQTTRSGRWKSLHVQSGLSVEVPSSASQRIVLSSSSASQFLVFLLS